MTVKLPFSGFVSGQNIPIICQIKNESKVKAESVKAALIKVRIGIMILNVSILIFVFFQRNNYYAEGERTSEIKKISQISSGETVCGEEKTHDMSLPVPSTPTTTSSECGSIIDTQYELKVSFSNRIN